MRMAMTPVARLVLLNAALALAYYVAARLGISASIGPGHVTALWPPSGLALAAFMLWGWRGLPGIALGSLALNWQGYLLPLLHDPLLAAKGAAILTSGSLLQSGAIAYFARRVPAALAAAPTAATLRFSVLVALGCAIAPTIGSSGLLWIGVVSSTEYVYGWLTWWVGDCAGMLVIAPPLLIWLHRDIRRDAIASLSFPIICMGLGLTLVAGFVVGHLEREARIDRFRGEVLTLAITLSHRIDAAQRDLEVLQAYQNKAVIDENSFHAVADPMVARSPWQLNLSWLPRVKDEDRDTFEYFSADDSGFAIREIDTEERVVRAARRSDYLPVLWVAPDSGREALLGIDESADPQRSAAIARALGTGRVAVSAPLQSVARIASDRLVITMYAPVWKNAVPLGETGPRDLLRGVASASIDLGLLLRAAKDDVGLEDARILFSDPDASAVSGIIWLDAAPVAWSRNLQQKEAAALAEGVHQEVEVQVADRVWHLLAQPSWAGTLWVPSLLQSGVAAAGVTFTALLAAFMMARRRRELAMLEAKQLLELQVQARTRELAEANRGLQEARERAESASQAKSHFLANMSHEIRTPLNAVLGYAQLLAEDAEPESPMSKRLSTILDAGQRLLRLINDVLDLSKIEAGSFELRTEPFDLRQELAEVVTLLSAKIRAKKLGMELDLAIPEHAVVEGDRGKLGQILINLLGNALKFTDHGKIGLRVWREGEFAVFEVSDTGPGISPEEQARLFSPFAQGKAGAEKGGTGLGLVVSRNIAIAMGGAMHIESTLGAGTKVRASVRLPELAPEALEAELHDAGLATHRLDAQVHCRVLVVEDDEASRDVLTQALLRTGCEVVVARDGAEAWEHCKQDDFDIVFTDIRMPVLNGVELLQRIRANPRIGATPVVAVSASSLVHERSFYIEQGFQDFVGKPYRFAEIHRMLSRHAGVHWKAVEPAAQAGSVIQGKWEPGEAMQRILLKLADAAAEGNLGRVQQYLGEVDARLLVTPAGEDLHRAAANYDFERVEAVAKSLASLDAGRDGVQAG